MTPAKARTLLLGFSTVAGPVIGAPAFVLVAAVTRADAWEAGLLVYLVAPPACCYALGRRIRSPGAGASAATIAFLSSVVTAVALLLYALAHSSFG